MIPDLLEVLDHRLLVTMPDGTVLATSRRLDEWLGAVRGSLVGRNSSEIGLAMSAPPPPDRRETRVVRKASGEEVRQHVRSTPVLGGDGSVRSWVHEVMDPPGEIEAALRRSEKNYRNLVETAQDLIWSVDLEGRFTFVNSAAGRILGYEPHELLGRRFQDLQDRAIAARDTESLRRSVEGGQPSQQYETILRHKDGRPVYLCANSIVLRDDEGRIVGKTGTSQDVTERRRTEEAMRHAQKLESLGVLAGGIAHDFNNLLVGVLGNAGLAEQELSPSSPVRRYLANISKAAQKAADLTRQLLAYTGKGRFLVRAIDLDRVVRDMVDLLEVSLPKKVRLQLDLAGDLPRIEADSGQIQQIVLNLVTNGAEAIERPSGVVTVTTGVRRLDADSVAHKFAGWQVEPGEFVYLEVSDDGRGMSPGVLDRIFDPFFSTKETGRGLGLAAILGIVRAHGGAIHVYSEVGRGSSFKVFLPVATGGIEEPEPAAAPPAWRGRGTVLVVDDDDDVRTAARLILEAAGFEVLSAASGGEALDLFRTHREAVSAVLLDMTMPGMSGEETFRELKGLSAEVRVLLSSGYNQLEALHRFVGRGLAGFIQKPYTPDALLAALRSVLA